ncbi:hypothetical protein K491DRAFT_782436 [Lophiostoma macrostomum CBS 122681]|uniref:Uncharacterized protein n=1 Tax=Lophiostoma macrostomum CBS 122681 TaxID=1314788 RepID=A0A6A6SWV5_9PLEO|nr:hypothetical protein K491DRAFT_782436 [Lophiostoma macrostomum CBS 122681]
MTVTIPELFRQQGRTCLELESELWSKLSVVPPSSPPGLWVSMTVSQAGSLSLRYLKDPLKLTTPEYNSVTDLFLRCQQIARVNNAETCYGVPIQELRQQSLLARIGSVIRYVDGEKISESKGYLIGYEFGHSTPGLEPRFTIETCDDDRTPFKRVEDSFLIKDFLSGKNWFQFDNCTPPKLPFPNSSRGLLGTISDTSSQKSLSDEARSMSLAARVHDEDMKRVKTSSSSVKDAKANPGMRLPPDTVFSTESVPISSMPMTGDSSNSSESEKSRNRALDAGRQIASNSTVESVRAHGWPHQVNVLLDGNPYLSSLPAQVVHDMPPRIQDSFLRRTCYPNLFYITHRCDKVALVHGLAALNRVPVEPILADWYILGYEWARDNSWASDKKGQLLWKSFGIVVMSLDFIWTKTQLQTMANLANSGSCPPDSSTSFKECTLDGSAVDPFSAVPERDNPAELCEVKLSNLCQALQHVKRRIDLDQCETLRFSPASFNPSLLYDLQNGKRTPGAPQQTHDLWTSIAEQQDSNLDPSRQALADFFKHTPKLRHTTIGGYHLPKSSVATLEEYYPGEYPPSIVTQYDWPCMFINTAIIHAAILESKILFSLKTFHEAYKYTVDQDWRERMKDPNVVPESSNKARNDCIRDLYTDRLRDIQDAGFTVCFSSPPSDAGVVSYN